MLLKLYLARLCIQITVDSDFLQQSPTIERMKQQSLLIELSSLVKITVAQNLGSTTWNSRTTLGFWLFHMTLRLSGCRGFLSGEYCIFAGRQVGKDFEDQSPTIKATSTMYSLCVDMVDPRPATRAGLETLCAID